MNIVFDLDGTLIDSRPRLHRLFQRLVPASTLSHDDYWALKKNRFSNEMILADRFGYAEGDIAAFVEAWMAAIETPDMLALDTNFPGMHARLAALRSEAGLHVCTARQHRRPVLEQLDRLGLLPFFDTVMVTGQTQGKEALIAGAVASLGAADWLIGDTGKDVQVGKALGMKTCAVLSGFMDRRNLLAYAPDLILESAADFSLPVHVPRT